jgi:hypothetical protein
MAHTTKAKGWQKPNIFIPWDRGPTTSIVVVVIIIIIITKVLKNSPLPWKRRKKEPKDNAKNLGFGLTLLAHIPSHPPSPIVPLIVYAFF